MASSTAAAASRAGLQSCELAYLSPPLPCRVGIVVFASQKTPCDQQGLRSAGARAADRQRKLDGARGGPGPAARAEPARVLLRAGVALLPGKTLLTRRQALRWTDITMVGRNGGNIHASPGISVGGAFKLPCGMPRMGACSTVVVPGPVGC